MKERFPEAGQQKQDSANEHLRKSVIKNTASRKQSAQSKRFLGGEQVEPRTNQGSREILIQDGRRHVKVEAGEQIALPKIPDGLQQPLGELI